MRISRSLVALGAMVLAGVLTAPAGAAARPGLPLTLVQQKTLQHNGQNPQASTWYVAPAGQLQLPTVQNGPGPKPKHDPYSALFLSDLFGSVQFYNLNSGPGVKPWLFLTGGEWVGSVVDEHHTLFVADEFGGAVSVPRGNLYDITILPCFCIAFDTKVDRQGNLYIAHLDGLFYNGIYDTIFVYAHGTLNYVKTIYDPNLKAPLFMAFDSKNDLATSGPNRTTGNWEVDVFANASGKPKRLQQISAPSYDQLSVAFDKNDNLIVGDFDNGTLAFYAPPYTHPPFNTLSLGTLMNAITVTKNPETFWLAGYDSHAPFYYASAAYQFDSNGNNIDNTALYYTSLPAGVAVDTP